MWIKLIGSSTLSILGRSKIGRLRRRDRPMCLSLRRSRPILDLLILLTVVLTLPAMGQAIPTPESVLGHKPGDDFNLASYDESRAYFRKLAASSDRIRLYSVGKTTRGLDW